MTINVAKYVGIPFAEHGRTPSGCDCWGLVRLFYYKEMGVLLPDLGPLYRDTTDADGMRRVYADQLGRWQPVDRPVAGDVALLNVAAGPVHVGVMVDVRRMLHVQRGTDAVIERVDSLLWKNRVRGFFRYSREDAA
jgi:cell wall-associated NlpC family hydrolase